MGHGHPGTGTGGAWFFPFPGSVGHGPRAGGGPCRSGWAAASPAPAGRCWFVSLRLGAGLLRLLGLSRLPNAGPNTVPRIPALRPGPGKHCPSHGRSSHAWSTPDRGALGGEDRAQGDMNTARDPTARDPGAALTEVIFVLSKHTLAVLLKQVGNIRPSGRPRPLRSVGLALPRRQG